MSEQTQQVEPKHQTAAEILSDSPIRLADVDGQIDRFMERKLAIERELAHFYREQLRIEGVITGLEREFCDIENILPGLSRMRSYVR